MSLSRRSLSGAMAIAIASGAVSFVAPSAFAAPDGSAVVINEVYGGGGNSGSVYFNDFVELYNPTGAPIDVSGWKIEQRSAANNVGNTVMLSGSIPAGGYFLVQGDAGATNSGALPTPDQTAKFGFSATNAVAALFDATGTQVDLVGWGSANTSEGAPAKTTANSTSIQRTAVGVDTDNNAADFSVAAPTPMNSGSAGTPTDPADPVDPVDPASITPIAQIQGTGATSPLAGQTVTTEGVVTAAYPEGGKNGFYLQTAGTGTAPKNAGDASDGIFVYMGSRTDYPAVGASVQVSGAVSEFYDVTQITASSITALESTLATPVAVKIDNLPAGNEAREPYEGMLLRPTGDYTVTNNYSLNSFGEVGLAPGAVAHRTPTDVVLPGAPAQALQAEQDAEVVYLDDGRTRNYLNNDKNTPLPYLITSDQGIKSLRTGDQVDFQTDVVVDFSHNFWRFQPLEPITGKNEAADLPITWQDSREATLAVPNSVQGEFFIASFNVLNYFTTLGEDVAGCGSYEDIYGNPVSTRNCDVRGAYSQQAFQDQQAKIVNAINRLDVSVLGLEEIENTYTVTGDVARRDEALSKLVDALNAAGGNWAYVKSPTELGTDEDFIRVAFIYNRDEVEPVGESRIFDDPAFTGTARQPLAQEFKPAGDNGENSFVAIVNHFKSKGSVANGDTDTGDGQGNNADVRTAQSTALVDHLEAQTDWAEKPVFILGDLNSYSKEDAVRYLEQQGFTNIESRRDFDGASYQFSGQLGSLDHVMGNEAAVALVQDAAVWNINADESVAFEYSRRNYNVQDFFQADNPFRSSDHDPIKVGFNLNTEPDPAPDLDLPTDSSRPSHSSSSGLLGGIISALVGATGVIALIVAAVNFLYPDGASAILARMGM
ncbi:ExeM/NucH family extracellular endonuclease [Corynebacterium qintianiae]|uniref:ExeM/NucH family extracellular endonuclease n=1 Tax=Corynebacterium qintianiae TaxID=2709392 RepID=A0A7T0PEM7_9CORY|nr:ExeM/NucH family extracellular endonuclease [Corynebacterium qintianiae]QPK82965.1 ExeM/NucH family extracellular endonuclease [Corynebacterium qintianiae]